MLKIGEFTKRSSNELHKAAASGDIKKIRELLRSGVDVNTPYVEDNNESIYAAYAIDFAAENGQLKALKILLKEYQAIVYLPHKRSFKLSHFAVKGGIDVVKFFEPMAEYFWQDINIERISPLHIAASYGQIDVLKYLQSLGLSFDVKDINGATLQHRAAASGQLEVLKYLKEQGCSLNVKDHNGATLLHYACANGQLEVLKYLADQSLDLNVGTYNDANLQYLSADYCKLETTVTKIPTKTKATTKFFNFERESISESKLVLALRDKESFKKEIFKQIIRWPSDLQFFAKKFPQYANIFNKPTVDEAAKAAEEYSRLESVSTAEMGFHK